MSIPCYFVYDFDISNSWILNINLIQNTIIWNPDVYIPEKYKSIYLKKYLNQIKIIAKTI